MKYKATTAIVLDTRYKKSTEEYPIKLRVTYNRRQKYYRTGYDATPEDFDKIQGSKPRQPFKDIAIELSIIEKKAIGLIDKLSFFTFPLFEKEMLMRNDRENVYSLFEERIAEMKREGRISTANNYKCSLNSLKSFKKNLEFSEITSKFLNDYENWMKHNGKTDTTVGFYLRPLRAIFKYAKDEGFINGITYPFGRNKYSIPAGKNIKKALKLSDIEKIFNYNAIPGSTEEKAKDLWVFSYLTNGINIKDIARLKQKDITGNKVTFIRAKTARTTKSNKKFVVAVLTPEAKAIIQKWGLKAINPNGYIFPILQEGMNPEDELRTIRQLTKTVNKYIKRIAKTVGIEQHVTTYSARHSFSTILKRSGAPIEFISESLGHSNLKTTESYLDSFEDEVKEQYAAHLTAFNKAVGA